MSEDQEVEPGMAWNQKWDLEGFFRNGNMLSMVGGFNFETGGYDSYRDRYWGSGDIFFDVDGTPQYGTDTSLVMVGVQLRQVLILNSLKMLMIIALI